MQRDEKGRERCSWHMSMPLSSIHSTSKKPRNSMQPEVLLLLAKFDTRCNSKDLGLVQSKLFDIELTTTL